MLQVSRMVSDERAKEEIVQEGEVLSFSFMVAEFSQGMLLPQTGNQPASRGSSPSGKMQPVSGGSRTSLHSAGMTVYVKCDGCQPTNGSCV